MFDILTCEKESFCVIGKEGKGPSLNSQEWIGKLWAETNAHYYEVDSIAKKDKLGKTRAFWGAMSNYEHTYLPWTDGGIYLAGVEVENTGATPRGWTKWIIPGYHYLYAKVENNYHSLMDYVIKKFMPAQKLELVGAIHEYYCPEEDGQLYLFFPITKL